MTTAARPPRKDPPWYAAVLAAWRKRADTGIRDALWAAAAWAESAADLARAHPACPRAARRVADIEERMLNCLSEDPAALLLVINERIALREKAKAAPTSATEAPADRGRPRTRERQWLIPR